MIITPKILKNTVWFIGMPILILTIYQFLGSCMPEDLFMSFHPTAWAHQLIKQRELEASLENAQNTLTQLLKAYDHHDVTQRNAIITVNQTIAHIQEQLKPYLDRKIKLTGIIPSTKNMKFSLFGYVLILMFACSLIPLIPFHIRCGCLGTALVMGAIMTAQSITAIAYLPTWYVWLGSSLMIVVMCAAAGYGIKKLFF